MTGEKHEDKSDICQFMIRNRTYIESVAIKQDNDVC